MPGTSSINGVISGMSTDAIIAKIMDVARQPVTDMTNKQTGLNQQLAAWRECNTRLLALQTSASAISNPSTFASNAVTSSDEGLLTGTAQPSAAAGTYYIKVTSRAQTQQLSSQGFADMTDAVGTGTVHISIADGSAFDVTIGDSNNSLAGLRDAINKAGKGVSAAIVNTGDADKPYRLLITSKGSGEKNAMTITSDSESPDKVAIDQVVQAATDATLELGSGAGLIRVKKSTNTMTDVIPGVTLNIRDFDATRAVTLQVGPDVEAIQKKIDDFVTQYNNVIDFFSSQFKFDMQANSQGVLFGDYQLQIIQTDLSSALSSPASAASQQLKVLSQIGITMGTDGKLAVDDSKLDDVIKSNLAQMNTLFSVGFDSPDANVSFLASTENTKTSPSAGYEVSVTTPASRARITSGTEQSGALLQSETLTLNGSTITLDEGMTQDQVIARINENSGKTGVKAMATGADGTGSGNFLTLQQASYGADHEVKVQSSVVSGSGNASGIGNVELTAAGQDMVGTINGVEAKANGQFLTAQPGAAGNNPAQGLCLRIDSAVPTTTTVRFSKGVGLMVRDLVSNVTALKGGVTTAQHTINTEIADVKKQIEDMNKRLDDKQQRLYNQFNAMETALGKLQQQGQAITSLIGSLNSSSSSSSSE